jgi:hypothetical protein
MSNPNDSNTMFVQETRLVAGDGTMAFNKAVEAAVRDGFVPHGQHVATCNALNEYNKMVTYSMLMVKYDPRLKVMLEKQFSMIEQQLEELAPAKPHGHYD